MHSIFHLEWPCKKPEIHRTIKNLKMFIWYDYVHVAGIVQWIYGGNTCKPGQSHGIKQLCVYFENYPTSIFKGQNLCEKCWQEISLNYSNQTRDYDDHVITNATPKGCFRAMSDECSTLIPRRELRHRKRWTRCTMYKRQCWLVNSDHDFRMTETHKTIINSLQTASVWLHSLREIR